VTGPLPRPRDEVGKLVPYRTQQYQADVRLQANEWAEPNPAGSYLSAEELDAVLLNRYPPAATEVRGSLASRFGVEPEQLVFGNGSNETLLYTFLAFGGHGRTTLVFEPTYAMHARLATLAGGEVAREQVGLPYELTARRALAAAARVRPDIVCFCTPNNPSGNRVPDLAILKVAERWPETLVLVDEAYSDFAGFTLLGEQRHFPNLVISKTFSKVRAAAGLRLGIVIAHPEIASAYRAVELPYSVNAVTYAIAARMVQREEPAIAHRVELARAERAKVYAALQRVDGIEAFPSETNFLLFRLRDGDVARVHARFLERGVLIRDISNWPGCERCLRVSIGTPAENERFVSALEDVFAAATA
jgi:histidinol-phosphate aminotransferase